MSTPSPAISLFRIFLILAVGGAIIFAVWTLVSTNNTLSDPTLGTRSPMQILQAAAAGDHAAVERELKAGADKDVRQLFSTNEQGMTPLMYAIRAGSLPAAKLLIEKQCNVNIAAGNGRTALMYAAMGDEPALVRLLIDAKASVSARAEDGWTALMLASARGKTESVKALLAAGADVGQRNRWRQTALMVASRTGDIETVKALLASGSLIDDVDADGSTALSVAVSGADNPEVVALLIANGSKVDAADNEGMTPLMRAAERGSIALTKLLLDKKADPTMRDRRGWRALEWANNRGDAYGQEVAATLTKTSQ